MLNEYEFIIKEPKFSYRIAKLCSALLTEGKRNNRFTLLSTKKKDNIKNFTKVSGAYLYNNLVEGCFYLPYF